MSHDKVREKFLILEESLFKAWNDYLALKEEYKAYFEPPEPEVTILPTPEKYSPPITPEQLEVIKDDLQGYEDIAESLLYFYKITNLEELPLYEFKLIRDKINKIKRISRTL